MLKRIYPKNIQQLLDGEEPGYKVVWAPVFLGIGIGSYFALFQEPLWRDVAVGLVIVVPLSFILVKTGMRPIGYGLLIMCLGFVSAKWRTDSVAAAVLQQEVGPVMVEGRVIGVDHQPGTSVRLTLGDLQVSRLNDIEVPARIRITVRTGGDAAQPLDRVKMLAMLMPPSAPVAPGAFDFSRQA